MITVFLNAEKNVVKENGIILLNDIYKKLCDYISGSAENAAYEKPFLLFNEVGGYMVEVLQNMPPEKVQKYFDWNMLITHILYTSFHIGYKEDSTKIELHNMYRFAQFAGEYLSTHYSENYALYWRGILESSFNISPAPVEYSCAAEPPVRCGVSHLSGQA